MSAGRNEKDYLATLHDLWEKAWPKGLPRSPNYLHGEVPLTEYLRAWAKQSPARPAVIFYGHVTTYAELDQQSDRFAALLRRRACARAIASRCSCRTARNSTSCSSAFSSSARCTCR